MKVMSEAREVILHELNKEGLSKEERARLIGILEKATPCEEAIQGITRGTSVAKTALAVVGVVTAAFIFTRRKS